jgi:hypothetical protein
MQLRAFTEAPRGDGQTCARGQEGKLPSAVVSFSACGATRCNCTCQSILALSHQAMEILCSFHLSSAASWRSRAAALLPVACAPQVDFSFLKALTKRSRFGYAIVAVAYGSFSLGTYLAASNSTNLTAAIETSSSMDVSDCDPMPDALLHHQARAVHDDWRRASGRLYFERRCACRNVCAASMRSLCM